MEKAMGGVKRVSGSNRRALAVVLLGMKTPESTTDLDGSRYR
jgi:hypothetical protein